MSVTKEEFAEWRNSKVTKSVFEGLEDLRMGYMMNLANGATLGDNTVENTAKLVGRIQGINDLLLIEYGEDNA